MVNRHKSISNIGRANTVLVHGYGDDTRGILTTIIAKVCEQNGSDRIRLAGPASFDEKAIQHIKEILLPGANKILKELNLPESCFELSVVNLDAASMMGVELNISGSSADAAVFLAIISCALQMAIPDDVLCTGQIASSDGDLRMVKSLPVKITAAVESKYIRVFIHPVVDADGSLNSLSPEKKLRLEDAITRAEKYVKLIAVSDVGDLFQEVFSEEEVILASLKSGFFKIDGLNFKNNSGIGKVIRHLAYNNEHRFWDVLEKKLFSGQDEHAKELIDALSDFYIGREIYPKNFGLKLLRLIHSIPLTTRRFKLRFPLIAISKCIQLSRFSQESDHKDILNLFRASSGEKSWETPSHNRRLISNDKSSTMAADEKLQFILDEINLDTLNRTIGSRINLARGKYFKNSVIIEDNEEFNDSVTSFYIHLMRYTQKVMDPVDSNAADRDAFDLLEEAFANKGGYKAAYAEARNGINGGLKYVLDMMANQFQKSEMEKRVQAVFKLALDPLDHEGQKNLITGVLKRFGNLLPSEIASLPPERFVTHYEILVKQYVKVVDDLKSIFRSF